MVVFLLRTIFFSLSILCLFLSPIGLDAKQSKLIKNIESLDLLNIPPVTVTLLSENETIQPGHPFWVTFHIKIQEGWHVYWKNPGDSGFPLSVQWELPKGFHASSLHWQVPHRIINDKNDKSVSFGYDNEVYLLAEITPPDTLPSNPPIEINATIQWLVCSQSTCLPGNTSVSVPLPTSLAEPESDKRWTSHFTKARAQLPKKIWSLTGEQNGNTVVMHIHSPYVDTIQFTKASFFPEVQCIDCSVEPQLKLDEENRGHYSLELQLASSLPGKQPPRSLKGVLVFEGLHGDEKHTEALDVDIWINSSSENSVVLPPSDEETEQAIAYSQVGIEAEDSQEQSTHSSQEVSFQVIALAIVFAFLGGSLLNLMPCVLPVLSFKVLSFMNMAGQKRSLTFKHGLIFALGVLVSFWVLAGTLLILQAYGKSVGWGFQLQEPIFVALLATVFLVFSLGLFGLFEIGVGMASWAGQVQSRSKEKFTGSFFSGVLATAVATPCTGPFLGAAVGMAVTLPPLWGMIIFTFLALGMAFPYILLSAFPSLLRLLPKPGTWMERFKELMGFFLLLTTLWLVWVFGAQTNNSAVFMLLFGLLCVSLATWIWGKWGTLIQKPTVRYIGRAIAVAVFLIGGYIVVYSPQIKEANVTVAHTSGDLSNNIKNQWEPFSAKRIAELQSQGVPVLVDFTAKWCLVCQANHVVFSQEDVDKKLNQLGVVRMLADWTNGDESITQELKKFQRNSVPLYLLYGSEKSKHPEVLPQVLTSSIVLEYLDEMSPTE